MKIQTTEQRTITIAIEGVSPEFKALIKDEHGKYEYTEVMALYRESNTLTSHLGNLLGAAESFLKQQRTIPVKMRTRLTQILEWAKTQNTFKTSDVSKALNISTGLAQSSLEKMRDEGLLHYTKVHDRLGYYSLPPEKIIVT